MGDENKIRDAGDAIKGVVEAVPVYQDVLQPAAQEIGKGLQNVAKLVHVALAPISLVVWSYEKIIDYLQETLSKKLENVPPEQIVPPKMTIAGPVIEQLRFTSDEPSLRELYANLLASAMDSKTAEDAHPAFVEIIRQLAPDEARLLSYMWGAKTRLFPLLSGYVTIKGEGVNHVHKFKRICSLGKKAACAFPKRISSYLDNLRRLGLLEVGYASEEDDAKFLSFRAEEGLARQDARESFSDFYKSHKREAPPPVFISNREELIKEFLRFTSLGRQFCLACLEENRH